MGAANRAVFAAAGALLAVCILSGCSEQQAATPTILSPAPAKRPAPVAVPQPVSKECNDMVQVALTNGLIRPGSVDKTGAVILTDARWTKLSAPMQEGLAVCISHYLAGGQDKWIKRIQFRNQASGVTYGTLQNSRYAVQQ